MSVETTDIDVKDKFVELYNNNQDILKNGTPDYINQIREKAFVDLNTEVIILLNGWYYNREKQLAELPGGAVIGSFQKATEEYPELVKKHFNQYADNEKEGLVALNTAFVKDGIFLYVPKGVIIEKPIQIINLLMDDEDGFAQHRNLFILEENSQVSLVVCDHTLSTSNFLTN